MSPPSKTRNGARATARTTGTRKGTRARAAASGRTSAPARKRRPSSASSFLDRTARAVVPWLVVVSVVGVAWSFYPALRIQYREQKQKERLQAELDGLRDRNDRLREDNQWLQSPAGVESVARESLGMVQEGERAYVVVDDTSQTPQPTTAEPDRVTRKPEDVLTRFLDWVFGVQ